jgi:hypothetical protein
MGLPVMPPYQKHASFFQLLGLSQVKKAAKNQFYISILENILVGFLLVRGSIVK